MKKAFLITLLAAGMTVTMTSGTVAQEREGGMGSGMMQGDMPSGMMRRMQRSEGGNRLGGPQGNMCPGMPMGSGMTCPCMEGGMHHGMMDKRLKLGDVKTDDATITADVVTVDNSLVQRLKINRRTGEIDYED